MHANGTADCRFVVVYRNYMAEIFKMAGSGVVERYRVFLKNDRLRTLCKLCRYVTRQK